MDEASRGKDERESDKINYMKDIGLEALERQWGGKMNGRLGTVCKDRNGVEEEGQRKVKEHAGMDEATVVAFMLVSSGPQLSMDI